MHRFVAHLADENRVLHLLLGEVPLPPVLSMAVAGNQMMFAVNFVDPTELAQHLYSPCTFGTRKIKNQVLLQQRQAGWLTSSVCSIAGRRQTPISHRRKRFVGPEIALLRIIAIWFDCGDALEEATGVLSGTCWR